MFASWQAESRTKKQCPHYIWLCQSLEKVKETRKYTVSGLTKYVNLEYIAGRTMKRFLEILNCKEKAPQEARLRKGLKIIFRTRAGSNIIKDTPTNEHFFIFRGFRPFPFLPVSTFKSSSWHIAIRNDEGKSKCQTRHAHGF